MRVRVIYASSLFLVSALALPQTIYDVTLSVPPLTGAPAASNAVSLQESISVTAEGIGPDGWTTYVEVAAMTEIIIDAPTVTLEYTIFETLVEGASGLRETVGGVAAQTCIFGVGASAACVENLPGSTVGDLQFTGSLVPLYTLTGGTPAPSTTAPAPSKNPAHSSNPATTSGHSSNAASPLKTTVSPSIPIILAAAIIAVL